MKKVIVVDDDIVMFRLFQVQVRRAGCEGFFFQDGQSLLDQFEQIKPDLAVLDYSLPDFRGDELYRRIRLLECGKDVPVVFVTGTVEDEELQAIQEIGAAAFLSKPFSPRRLQTLIKELLDIS